MGGARIYDGPLELTNNARARDHYWQLLWIPPVFLYVSAAGEAGREDAAMLWLTDKDIRFYPPPSC